MNQKKAKRLRKIAKRLALEKGIDYELIYSAAKKKYKSLSNKERNI